MSSAKQTVHSVLDRSDWLKCDVQELSYNFTGGNCGLKNPVNMLDLLFGTLALDSGYDTGRGLEARE